MIFLAAEIKALMLKAKKEKGKGKSFDPKEWLEENLEKKPTTFDFMFDTPIALLTERDRKDRIELIRSLAWYNIEYPETLNND